MAWKANVNRLYRVAMHVWGEKQPLHDPLTVITSQVLSDASTWEWPSHALMGNVYDAKRKRWSLRQEENRGSKTSLTAISFQYHLRHLPGTGRGASEKEKSTEVIEQGQQQISAFRGYCVDEQPPSVPWLLSGRLP